jgi:hypothetical protein
MNPYCETDKTKLSEDGELYQRSIEMWGIDAQLNMVTQELGELVVAIQRWKRKPCETTVIDIAYVVADVELALGQLQYMMDRGIERKYGVHLDNARKEKRENLLQMLDGLDILQTVDDLI